MSYGIPYMGSKSKICKDICKLFPRADNFYDLFGGGFSITHFMLAHRSKDFKEFHFNEIRQGIPELIKDAIQGKYSYKNYLPKWISREEFLRLKDTDPLIKIIWSFGSSGINYLFGEDIEQYKKSMHNAIVFNEFDDEAKKIFGIDKFKDGFSILDRRLYLRYKQKNYKQEHTEQLEQLERLQQLERLHQLQQLERLRFYSLSYEQVPIKDNSIIYCDIPYKGTAEYDRNKQFNHEDFFDWADNQTNPVFISEYNISDKRFTAVLNVKKRSMLSALRDKTIIKEEKVYVNRSGFDRLFKSKVR